MKHIYLIGLNILNINFESNDPVIIFMV